MFVELVFYEDGFYNEVRGNLKIVVIFVWKLFSNGVCYDCVIILKVLLDVFIFFLVDDKNWNFDLVFC